VKKSFQKIACRRCGREIEKRGSCPHCQSEEVNERRSIQWQKLPMLEFVRMDEMLEEKYKNAG